MSQHRGARSPCCPGGDTGRCPPALWSSPGRAGEERREVPDGILINNNAALPLRWDKPCCKSPPFPQTLPWPLKISSSSSSSYLSPSSARIRLRIQTCYNAARIPVPREPRAHPARLKAVSLARFVMRYARLVSGALLRSCHSIDLASHSQPHYLYLISTRPFWGVVLLPTRSPPRRCAEAALAARRRASSWPGRGARGTRCHPTHLGARSVTTQITPDFCW